MSDIPRQPSRGSEPATDGEVKYTKVTGRISKAKKGVKVHVCELCTPSKTFTRAEHLRRHQLSHQQPAHPCTYDGCLRAFHRPDLLARHLLRHETQRDGTYPPGDPSSRASSVPSETQTPLSQGGREADQETSSDLTLQSFPDTQGNSTSFESAGTSSSSRTIRPHFPNVEFSSNPSPEPSTSHPDISRQHSYPSTTLGSNSPRSTPPYSQINPNYPIRPRPELGSLETFVTQIPTHFGEDLYRADARFQPHINTTQAAMHTHNLDEAHMPGLSYAQDNSPWCSSASSTYSTQSEGSRRSQHLASRDRSASIGNIPEWTGVEPAHHWHHGVSAAAQDLRSSPFDPALMQYGNHYTPPRMSPPPAPAGPLLDLPNTYGGLFMESVGPPALPSFTKPQTQLPPAFPPGVSGTSPTTLGEGSPELVASQRLGNLTIATALSSSYCAQISQLESYISNYWKFFNPSFPVVHPHTFCATDDNLLTSSMAAIGTQYENSVEARQKGVELNEYCRKSIDLLPQWSLHTMQAVLLTELFSRFRGRRTKVRCSRRFEELYRRLSIVSVPSNDGGQDVDFHRQWAAWIDLEVRRRLLIGCFTLDVHQAMYQEQPFSRAHLDSMRSLLYVPSPEAMWECTVARDWHARATGHVPQPLVAIEQGFLRSNILPELSHFGLSLFISSQISRLPHRNISNAFSITDHEFRSLSSLTARLPSIPLTHSYLALYYTPLRDLLAVAGDTWVFAQKIMTAQNFYAAERRLKTWTSSLAAAQATLHACHVVAYFFSQPQSISSEDRSQNCLSNYWSLYTATLVCWAFGYKSQAAVDSRFGTSGELCESDYRSETDCCQGALAYVDSMLAYNAEELLARKGSINGDSSALIEAAKLKLESDGIGSKCMMLVEAATVLGHIKNARKSLWF